MMKSNPSLPPKVVEVLKSEFKAVDPSSDLAKYTADFEAKHKDSALYILSAVAAKRVLGQDKGKADKQLVDTLGLPGTKFADAAEILSVLKGWRSTEVAGFQKAAQNKWPEVTRLT